MVERPDFKSGAKSQMILEADSNLVRFYNTVARAIPNTIIQWDPIIKDFKKEWEIFVKRKGDDVLDVKNISETLPITR